MAKAKSIRKSKIIPVLVSIGLMVTTCGFGHHNDPVFTQIVFKPVLATYCSCIGSTVYGALGGVYTFYVSSDQKNWQQFGPDSCFSCSDPSFVHHISGGMQVYYVKVTITEWVGGKKLNCMGSPNAVQLTPSSWAAGQAIPISVCCTGC